MLILRPSIIGKFQNLDVTLFKYSTVCHEKNPENPDCIVPRPDHSGEHGNTALPHRTTRCSHRFLDPPGDDFSLVNHPYRLETRELSHPIQGDLEILSVGSLLVSTNPRLAVHFDARVGDHVLTIRQVIITMIMIIDYFDL